MGHDGEDEMEEIEEEFEEIVDQHISECNDTTTSNTLNHDIFDHDQKFAELIAKHFKQNPIKTPYSNNFLSLWWVDYF